MISNSNFLNQFAKIGIGIDSQSSGLGSLHYMDQSESLYVDFSLPKEVAQRRGLVSLCVKILGAETKYLWKRGGIWSADHLPENLPGGGELYFREGVYHFFWSLGIRDGEHTLSFDASDDAVLACFIFLNSSIAWKNTDDLFLLSDSGDLIIYFDSHDEVRFICKDVKVLNRIQSQLISWQESGKRRGRGS